MTRICVFGAGAIGGFLAGALATAGAEVSIVARGPHLEAIRARGLTVRWNGSETTYRLSASDDPACGSDRHMVPSTLPSICGSAKASTWRALPWATSRRALATVSMA